MSCLLDCQSHIAEINTHPMVIAISSSIASVKICDKSQFSAHCLLTVLKQSSEKINNKGSQIMKLRA